MTILIAYEDIVFSPRRNSGISAGEDLLRMLASLNRVVVLSDAPKEAVERHLMISQITGVADVLDSSVRIPDMDLRKRQVEIMRSRGAVSFFITPDPLMVEWAIFHGIVTLMYVHPKHVPLRSRPDRESKVWTDLVMSIENRAIAKADREKTWK